MRASATVLALCLVALSGALAYGATILDRHATRAYDTIRVAPTAIRLCATHDAPPRKGTQLSPALLAAAVLALDDDERAELSRTLDAVNERWAALANPLFDTLDEEDADLPLTRLLRRGPQAIIVAASASRGVACATDGLCARGAATQCPPGFEEASGRDVERARFLAWPYGYALRVRAASETDARAIAAELRGCTRHGKRIALVVTPFDHEDVDRSHSSLVSAWTRHEALVAFVRGRPDAGAQEAYFPLSLGKEDVVVMPKLEAIVAPEQLAEEAERCIRDARAVHPSDVRGPVPRVSRLVP
jgi:hypothetical protein